MKLYDLLKEVGLSDGEIESINVDHDREVVVYTDRQLLPNSAYNFEVEADGDDIELHVTRRT